ncbi:MAG: response regulator [Verrucomicrobiae bacterium]|nr:response regulator [Verrucomicrobiae bacterium]NNJ42012.1 response regulator [Akkermansiaceae bacterium]
MNQESPDSPKKTKILVVDDETAITQMLDLNLSATGNYEVLTTNESLKAKALAAEFLPDILLLDVVMPGLDGGDVLREIRSIPELSQVPAVMVTALVSNKEISHDGVVTTGDCVMLPKPVRLARLINTIEMVLANEL